MPRVKKYFEMMVSRFLTGTFERIDSVLTPTEDRAEFVRAAVERELKRRVRAGADPLARHLAPPTAREIAARKTG
jgi:hypothetical protein